MERGRRRNYEQVLADLEARKQKILEMKRKSEEKDRSVFGETLLTMLNDMHKQSKEEAESIFNTLEKYMEGKKIKGAAALKKIIARMRENG